MKRLHLLRPGEFTDARGTKVSLSESEIRDIAAGYDPSRHEAPLVVGHPRSDKPAFGWIDKLEAGSRGLFGTPKQVAPEFSEAVQKGSYKKISASLYGPDNPRNTNPGKWSLRHVGFLGAQPPAVSGLQDVQFAEDDEADLVIEADFAATCCEANQRDRLEKLCRYITRPAIANERLSLNDRGQVIYRFKQPFRDGTTHVVLDPMDFIARLAALVPRPRLNLTRFHGVFAPNCKHRKSVVPKRKPNEEQPNKPLAPMTWTQRLKRVFAIDIETCPVCGGKLRVIACIEDPEVIARILDHVRQRDGTELPQQPRAPPTRCEHLDAPNQDRLF